ncbi:MAG: hypothetical protein OSJ43_11370 [Oscillospiraceae bacterium]|nr:hypothetical protein [Oscillospiraceae bacterium]
MVWRSVKSRNSVCTVVIDHQRIDYENKYTGVVECVGYDTRQSLQIALKKPRVIPTPIGFATV